MARTQDIRQGYFDTSVAVRVDEDVYGERTKRVEPTFGDLLFSREGTYFGDAAEVPKDMRVCLGQRMVLIRPDPEIVRPSYLRMQINSAYFQSMLRQYRDGTVAERLNLPVIRSLQISVPPLAEQDFIIRNISPLERKIELNHQMNTTLEAVAQALFKSWFVDFDPVIDNALAAGNPIPDELAERGVRRAKAAQQQSPEQPHTLPAANRQQFPDRFVFTETMGWVPEGWEDGNLSHIAKLVNKSVQPNLEPHKLWSHFSIPAYDSGMSPAMDLGETIKSGKYKVPTGSVLVSKLNPQTPRIWLPAVNTESTAVCSTEFMPFVPVNSDERIFLYSLFCSDITQSEISQRVSGTTGSRQRVSPKDIAVLPALIPPGDLRVAFSSMLDSSFIKQQENNLQIKKLADLRDTLLPKLLSGQLRIPEAEQLVAEVI